MRDTATFDKDTPVKPVEIGYYSFVERNDFVVCPRCRKRLYAPRTTQVIVEKRSRCSECGQLINWGW